MIAVAASDDRLPDFYDVLASRLEGRGTLYVPHVVIPPNARVAVRRPPRLVVGVASAGVLDEVEAWADEYLATGPTAELRFTRRDRTVVLGTTDLGGRRGRLADLLEDEPATAAVPPPAPEEDR